MTTVNKEQKYVCVRYYKYQKRCDVLKNNLTIEEARDFCENTPTRYGGKKKGYELGYRNFNSFVGFTHMSNL